MSKKLTIGILSFARSGKSGSAFKKYSKEISMLKSAIKGMGHIPRVYSVYGTQLFFNKNEASILEKNEKIKPCDVLIPRFYPVRNLDLEVSILKQFKLMGIPVMNEHLPTLNAKNKLRTMQILTSHGIPVPRTVVVRKFEYLDDAIKAVGGYPVILKSPYGSLGCGVVIVESRRSLYSALDMLVKSMRSTILMIQEYVSESEGADYRAFVVGDKVVGAMKRQSMTGDFRSNLHLGGEARKVDLTDKEKKLSIKATKSIGLKMAGVDILRSKNGPVIMEINANPGILGISSIADVDITDEIVKYAVALAVKKKGSK